LERSIDLLRARPTATTASPFLCTTCTVRNSPFSTTTRLPEQAKVPYTDKIRRKLWGTESPPGQQDPYGKASQFDQTTADVEGAKQPNRSPELQAMMDAYEPSTSWEGLESVGGFGNWWRDHWDADHAFQGFMPANRVADPNQLTAALHRSIVEVFALRQAGYSITNISNMESDFTTTIQIRPSLSGAELQFTDAAEKEQLIRSLLPSEEAPTESEQDITADRSDIDPLNPADETAVKNEPTESEEDVAADRSEEDPLHPELQSKDYQNQIASWDASWLQVSLADAEIKFAVSSPFQVQLGSITNSM